MIKYRFLLKPAFFIFNLIFATWLVLKIEEINPSDFGKYGSIFEEAGKLTHGKMQQKKYLDKLVRDYKYGKLDSVEFDKKLERYLLTPNVVGVDGKKVSVK